jgi:biopolymer transport protein ExbD
MMRIHRSRGRSHGGDSTGIDLAPMLDFVLNLLIFFIITAVFVKEVGFPVNRPGGGSASTSGKASDSLVVALDEQGHVYVDGREIDVRSVRANVERFHGSKPEAGVLVIADHQAGSGLVVQVVDQIHLAGVENVSFATGSEGV